ncbi:Uncharacterised protein [Mycobacteroides abscessus subsp. abscessus]|nr:Uncharacterised protein [Mycobacteroides abscessus subsp. abscessus]
MSKAARLARSTMPGPPLSSASLYSMAVSAAASKIFPLPSFWAFWRAVL